MKKTTVSILMLGLVLVLIPTSVSAHGHNRARNNSHHSSSTNCYGNDVEKYVHHDVYANNNQNSNYQGNQVTPNTVTQNNALSMDELINYYEKQGITIEKVESDSVTLTKSELALVENAIKANNLTGTSKNSVDNYHVTFNDHEVYDEEHHLETTISHDITLKIHHDGTYRQILSVNNSEIYCNDDHYTVENLHGENPCFNAHSVTFNKNASVRINNSETHHYGYQINHGVYGHVNSNHNYHEFSGCNEVFELYPNN